VWGGRSRSWACGSADVLVVECGAWLASALKKTSGGEEHALCTQPVRRRQQRRSGTGPRGAHSEIGHHARVACSGKAVRVRTRPPVRTRAAARVRGGGTLAWRSGHGTRDWNLGVLRVPNAVVPPPPNRVHGEGVCTVWGVGLASQRLGTGGHMLVPGGLLREDLYARGPTMAGTDGVRGGQ